MPNWCFRVRRGPVVVDVCSGYPSKRAAKAAAMKSFNREFKLSIHPVSVTLDVEEYDANDRPVKV